MAVKIDSEKEVLKAGIAGLETRLANFLRFEHRLPDVVSRLTGENFVGTGTDETCSAVVFVSETLRMVVSPADETFVLEALDHPDIRRAFYVRDGKTTSAQVDAIIATAARAQRAKKKGGEVIADGVVIDLLDRVAAEA